jgi:uncharacterized protein YqeY
MKILEQLQADLKTAMLNKEEAKKSIIRVMIGELNRIDKTLPEAEIEQKSISSIKKMWQNAVDLNETEEASIIETYLPKMLSEDEVEFIIETIMVDNGFSSIKDMGKVMSELKNLYNGQYDGKLASDLIKKHLS